MTHVLPLILFALTVAHGDAQEPDTVARPPATIIRGMLTDSLAGKPLAGATVQLVASDDLVQVARTATSDSLGGFEFAGVVQGLYLLGFIHPLLDSLDLEPAVLQVRVTGLEPVQVHLAVPSARSLRTLACGSPGGDEPPAAVVGIVRYAVNAAPVANATVRGGWLEVVLNRQGGVRGIVSRVAQTTATGRFALCNVPRPGVIGLVASLGGDSTQTVELEIPADGLLRRDLYLAGAGPRAAGEENEAGARDAPSPMPRVATVTLSGTVVTSLERGPIAGAVVGIQDGAQTRTDESGRWVLAGTALGTRNLYVRAVGYYPERIVIDVIPGARPLQTALPTMRAVLDTVRVMAERARNPRLGEFYQRRESGGAGRYLTPDDIVRYAPVYLSDVLRRQPGMEVERTGLGATSIRMRGIFADRCAPDIYVDGVNMPTLAAEDLDGLISPDEAAGIEIYPPGTAPPQFQRALGGCGSIVFWTRPPFGPPNTRSVRQRLLRLAGVAALSIGITMLLQ